MNDELIPDDSKLLEEFNKKNIGKTESFSYMNAHLEESINAYLESSKTNKDVLNIIKIKLEDIQNYKNPQCLELFRTLIKEKTLMLEKLKTDGYSLNELLEITKNIYEDSLEQLVYHKLVTYKF
jgi:hypothetical protein